MIPYTDYKCRLLLGELERGEKVIIPSSVEHAEFMRKVAQDYIDKQHQQLVNELKQEDIK